MAKKTKKEEKVEEVIEETPVEEVPEEPVKEEVVEKPKKKKKPILLIAVILLIIAALVGGIFIGKYLNDNDKEETETREKSKKDKKDKEEEKEDEEEKEEEEEEEPEKPAEEYKGELVIYKSDWGLCAQKDTACNKVAYRVKTKSTNTKVVDVDGSDYVLFIDGEEVKIFDTNKEKTTDTGLEAKYDEYDLGISNKKPYSIIYRNVTKKNYERKTTEIGYYKLDTKETLYKNKYDELYQLDNGLVNATKAGSDDQSFTDYYSYLLSGEKEELLLKAQGVCENYRTESSGNTYYVILAEGCVGGSSDTIYTPKFKEITSGAASNNYDIHDGRVYVVDGKVVKQYNKDGNVVKTSKEYEKILDIDKGYILYVDGDKLYVTNDEKYTKELSEWKDDYYYHWMISGYYDANQLQNETEKQAGLYYIVETGETDDGSGSGFEMYVNIKTGETKRYELEHIGGYAKPVLYLYPKKTTKVTVDFEHEDQLTTTYPKFKDSWVVTAKPNGDLYDAKGNYYYGLYWEEDQNHLVDFREGFYVTKENAIEFLEEKLTTIGLNARERNEFIMYWLPILEKNGQSLVYFELTEERDSYNKLEITPAPDSLLRVAIHVKKVNNKVNIKEQKLPTFERTGFTAVEWGGVQYK